jgi:3-mercaptopyruvate sulfurtransferase SseA
MTGSWLVLMGWPEVYVLDGGLSDRSLVPGSRKPVIPELDEADVATIDAAELKRLLDSGKAAVVDLAPSITYEAGHIPGAWFAVRARLPGSLEKLPRRPVLVLTSPDAALAKLAAAELADPGFPAVYVLDGGTEAWRDARLKLATGREAMADTPDDCWRRPYDPYAREGARERYLKWEIELVHQIEREGDVGFRVPEAAA